jgi:hypothetical protein
MQTQKLDYHPVNDMDQYWGVLQQLPAAWPNYFTIRGNSAVGFYMQLYPVPGAPGNLIVDYYRQAVAVPTSTASTSTATPIDTMSGWEDIVYDYAVYKASRASKNPMWQDGLQLYEKNLQSMIDKTRHMTDEGGNEITGPTPFMPLYLFQYGPDGY